MRSHRFCSSRRKYGHRASSRNSSGSSACVEVRQNECRHLGLRGIGEGRSHLIAKSLVERLEHLGLSRVPIFEDFLALPPLTFADRFVPTLEQAS